MRLTQYEISGEWSNSDFCEIFLAGIAEETSASLDVIGKSFLGKDIQRLTVGSGDRLLIVTGGVHRSEPASHELVLMKARDVAYNVENKYTDYLNDHTIMFIPTVQPDNDVTRENAQGININRDAYRLETPEIALLFLSPFHQR